MFYAHFVLSKKGPLARIWLAAHWDKKLTKAHVFETNIDSSVEAILKPKVKMALRTSGHLMLGVVRIYSRKAKYLLADCNEAFVKIKMAFRPGVVDLPEENREAAVAAITLQENFHDFETTLADLEDIDVQAQFSVNQSRPEEITMREDLGSITLMGDDGFGDVGFDEREILRDTTHLEDPLYKRSDMHHPEITLDEDHSNKTLTMDDPAPQKDIDLEPPVMGDDFGGGVGDGFMDAGADDDDDDDNDGNFGDVDQDFFGQWGEAGGLFEDTPMPEVPMTTDAEESGAVASAKPAEPEKSPEPAASGGGGGGGGAAEAEESIPLQATASSSAMSSGIEQTTLVHNEEEAFALEPLDVTAVPGGTERKGKRKRKLIVDEQKGIPSETMKVQLSDTSDIVTTLDLAPPTKKLMHWKETGGVEKLFALPGRAIVSRTTVRLFTKSLITRSITDELDMEEEQQQQQLPGEEPLPPLLPPLPLPPQPEVMREEDRGAADVTRQSEMSTIVEEPSNAADASAADVSTASVSTRATRRSERSAAGGAGDKSFAPKSPRRSVQPEPVPHLEPEPVPEPQDTFAQIPDGIVENPADPTTIEPSILAPHLDLEGPPSVAPFSVPPPSNAPPSVGAPAHPTFEDVEDAAEGMPETAEQDERRLNKRTQQMQLTLRSAFRMQDELSFKHMTSNHDRKQAASRFYTLLVLKKHQVVSVQQTEAFGDILITEGPHFGRDC
ncbi:double-strand-break repair protein rad21 homolog A-like isoform X2 [Babylonia areolata]|uniref:double-strand-break repair protein rad21 homolog A-like isoform X2 n=1 Tax=Babylonia areolata TaxID=304850 RepID=UPI003FD4697D